MNYLEVEKGSDTVIHGNGVYRIQNDRGHRHIVIYSEGKRKKITVKEVENDHVHNYIFNGGFKNYPCPAMDYWIYRHRLGNKISVSNYKIKFNINKK